MDEPTVAAVPSTSRCPILRRFVRRGLLDPDDAKDRGAWPHDSESSRDASERIESQNRAGLERLLRYGARPPFALARIERIDEVQILDHRPTPTPDGQTRRTRTPLAFISRLACWCPMRGRA